MTQNRSLWNYAFLWIGEASNLTILHPLDVERAKGVLSDLSAVGERPSDSDVKKFLDAEWGEHTVGSQQTLRKLWRLLLTNPRHRFRIRRDPGERFFTLDRLAQENGLRPLDDRLHQIGAHALDGCVRSANGGSVEEFNRAQHELAEVAKALTDLRRLRFGPTSVGALWDQMSEREPPRGTHGLIREG